MVCWPLGELQVAVQLGGTIHPSERGSWLTGSRSWRGTRWRSSLHWPCHPLLFLSSQTVLWAATAPSACVSEVWGIFCLSSQWSWYVAAPGPGISEGLTSALLISKWSWLPSGTGIWPYLVCSSEHIISLLWGLPLKSGKQLTVTLGL